MQTQLAFLLFDAYYFNGCLTSTASAIRLLDNSLVLDVQEAHRKVEEDDLEAFRDLPE